MTSINLNLTTPSIAPKIRVLNLDREQKSNPFFEVRNPWSDFRLNNKDIYLKKTTLFTCQADPVCNDKKVASEDTDSKYKELKAKLTRFMAKSSQFTKGLKNLLDSSKLSPEIKAVLNYLSDLMGGISSISAILLGNLRQGVTAFIKSLPTLASKIQSFASKIKQNTEKLRELITKWGSKNTSFFTKCSIFGSSFLKGIAKMIPVIDTASCIYDTCRYDKKADEAAANKDKPKEIIYKALAAISIGLTAISIVSSILIMTGGGALFKGLQGVIGGGLGLVDVLLGS